MSDDIRDELASTIAVAQNVPFTGPKQRRIADAILARYTLTPKEHA